jgi:hypothetical protein
MIRVLYCFISIRKIVNAYNALLMEKMSKYLNNSLYGRTICPFFIFSNMKKLLLFSFTLSFRLFFAQNTSYWQQHDYKMDVSMDVKTYQYKRKTGIGLHQ